MVKEIIAFLLEDEPVAPEADGFEDEDFENAKEVYGDPLSDWMFEIENGMLTVKFRRALAGQLKFRSTGGALTHARWLLPRFDKLSAQVPFDPNRYSDVWEWYDKHGNLLENIEDEPVAPLPDDFEDEDEAKDVFGPDVEEIYSLDDIKMAEPIFFSRKTMRFHGTKKIYKYGNFIVAHNRKKMGGHAFGVGNWNFNNYVIYHFQKTEESPEGTLRHKGNTGDLSDAKQMIKSGDFRSRRQKLGLPEV